MADKTVVPDGRLDVYVTLEAKPIGAGRIIATFVGPEGHEFQTTDSRESNAGNDPYNPVPTYILSGTIPKDLPLGDYSLTKIEHYGHAHADTPEAISVDGLPYMFTVALPPSVVRPVLRATKIV